MTWWASAVFRWLDLPFTLLPVLVLALLALLHDLARIRRAAAVWHARVREVGLEPRNLHPHEQDFGTRLRYDDVGRELRYGVGHLVGFVLAAFVFLPSMKIA